jgi:hypothetical protein
LLFAAILEVKHDLDAGVKRSDLRDVTQLISRKTDFLSAIKD